ncbi:unnamed protein product, partial [Symbiodinium microadriaticum]
MVIPYCGEKRIKETTASHLMGGGELKVNFLMYLEPFVGFLILANGILIGLQTDPTFEDWPHWVYVEMVFNFFLVLEDCSRVLCAIGYPVVDMAEMDVLKDAAISGAEWKVCPNHLSVVFPRKDLRLMVKGLIAGIWTLSLAFVLLFAVLYVIAGFATMILGHSNDLRGISEEYFYNIPISMFTAFRCFTGECVTKNGESITSILAEKYGVSFVLSFVVSY